MKSLQDTYAPGTDFHVVLKRPTPSDALLKLRARATELREDRAVVDATLGTVHPKTRTTRGLKGSNQDRKRSSLQPHFAC